MLRSILVGVASAVVGGVVGFRLGSRAGFDAGVRDYLENDARLIEKVADAKAKFDYEPTGTDDDADGVSRASQGFQ